MLVSPWQKVIFDVRVKHVGHFPCLSLLTPWCPGQAVFLPPGYTGRRAGGGQMINLGQMTTSSSKHGRVGQHQWPREQGSPSIQQGLAGLAKHNPTKKPPLLCNIHQKIHHRGTALFYPTHDVFTIHTFTQQQGHRSIGLFKMVKCVEKKKIWADLWNWCHFLYPCLSSCKKCSPAALSTVCLAAPGAASYW